MHERVFAGALRGPAVIRRLEVLTVEEGRCATLRPRNADFLSFLEFGGLPPCRPAGGFIGLQRYPELVAQS